MTMATQIKVLPIAATMAKIKTQFPKRIRERLRFFNRQALRELGKTLR